MASDARSGPVIDSVPDRGRAFLLDILDAYAEVASAAGGSPDDPVLLFTGSSACGGGPPRARSGRDAGSRYSGAPGVECANTNQQGVRQPAGEGPGQSSAWGGPTSPSFAE